MTYKQFKKTIDLKKNIVNLKSGNYTLYRQNRHTIIKYKKRRVYDWTIDDFLIESGMFNIYNEY